MVILRPKKVLAEIAKQARKILTAKQTWETCYKFEGLQRWHIS